MIQERDATYDLIVIGAGSAGFSAAITAADQGARVALVGHGALGGTCTNIGCIPSKALIHAAASVRDANAATRFAGVEARGRVADWAATVRQKDGLVAELRKARYADLLPMYETITYVEGRARLVAGGAVVGGETLAAPRVVVTTGARPAIPTIPGAEGVDFLTSTSALALDAVPASLLVIGGGYVGAELAQLFARAGAAVTVVCRSRLLPGAEPEIGSALTRYLAEDGVRVVAGVAYRAIRASERGVTLDVLGDGRERTIEAERVLAAAGRAPNTEDLGLADIGVETRPDGAVVVDDRMRTSRPGVYAAGDVTGADQFVYMAAYGAKLAALNALNGDALRYDNAAMPAVVFTDPQAASVGLTEAQARAASRDVRVSVVGLDYVPHAWVAHDGRGLIKLVADGSSRRLLGAHILAPHAGDAIQTAALALRGRLTIDDLAGALYPYLTTVEGLKLAALAFDKDLDRLSCCAG